MPGSFKRLTHGNLNEYYWDRLDNAAKIIPAVSSTRGTNVFRLTTALCDEVDPAILQSALELALKASPAFAVKLHRGLFWYYFDANHETPRVREEKIYPCSPIWRSQEGGYLFRVNYFHKRINLEVFHALSDGMGAVQFMYALVMYYFHLLDPDGIPEEFIRGFCDRTARDFDEDSFIRNSGVPSSALGNDTGIDVSAHEPDAFHIQGYKYDGLRLNALCAMMPTDTLLGMARAAGATLSEYMCALIIFSIYSTSYRRSLSNRPIAVNLPVNLRGMFESTTMRNFFGHVNISVKPVPDMTFEDILAEVKADFKGCLTRQYFERQISDNVRIERIPPVKFVPIWIKDIIVRHFFANAEKKYTITFSNLGRMKLPYELPGKIKRFEMMLGGSKTHPKKISACSYENQTALCFSSTIDDNSLEQFLLRWLTEKGVEVVISSNEMPEPETAKRRKTKKPKAGEKK